MLYRARPCIKREEMKKIKFQPLLTLFPTHVLLPTTPSNFENSIRSFLALCIIGTEEILLRSSICWPQRHYPVHYLLLSPTYDHLKEDNPVINSGLGPLFIILTTSFAWFIICPSIHFYQYNKKRKEKCIQCMLLLKWHRYTSIVWNSPLITAWGFPRTVYFQ